MKLKIHHNSITKNDTFPSINDASIPFHTSLPFYKPTPLVRLEKIAGKLGAKNVFVKDESNRLGLNSFKPLGAGYALYELKKEQDQKLHQGVVATTAGNHGIGVAYFAKTFDIPCSIILPDFVSKTREQYIKSLGAQVVRTSLDYDAAINWMKTTFSDKRIISDTAWKGYEKIPTLIKEGYYTLFDELITQLPDKPNDLLIFLQGGVGTFASSCISYFNSLRHRFERIRFAIVEPEQAACLLASARNKQLSLVTVGHTKASCLACGEPNPIEIDTILDNADYFIACSDEIAKQGVQTLEKVAIGTSFTGAITTGVLGTPDASELDISEETTVVVFNTERGL